MECKWLTQKSTSLRSEGEIRLRENSNEKLKRIQHLKNDDTQITNVSLNFQNFLDSGYAFSGERGNDVLVVDNITNRLKDALHK